MFGISAFSQSPFASLGGTPVQVDLSGVSAQALLSDPTNAVNVTIDAEANVTPSGQVGTGGAPTAGGSSGVDSYSFNIIKTADATYVALGNRTNMT